VTPGAAPLREAAEIRALTGLRGLAASMVLLFHFAVPAAPAGAVRTLLSHGFLWVDCFFVLSGFVMALSFPVRAGPGLGRRHLHFLGRRIARIYPLFAVTTLAAFAVTRWYPGVFTGTGNPAPWATLLANALMVQNAAWLVPFGPHDWGASANPAAWSISTEWLAYLIYPALALPMAVPRRFAPIAAALIATAMLFWLASATQVLTGPGFAGDVWVCRPGNAWRCPATGLAPGGPLGIWDGNSPAILRCLADFTLGLAAFRLRAHPLAHRALRNRGASSLLLVLIFTLLTRSGADVAIVLLFPLLIVSLLRNDAPCARLLAGGVAYRLGVLSYSIYMVHEPLRISALYPWLAARTAGPFMLALSSVAVVLPVAVLTFVLIERPGRVWLRAMLRV